MGLYERVVVAMIGQGMVRILCRGRVVNVTRRGEMARLSSSSGIPVRVHILRDPGESDILILALL